MDLAKSEQTFVACDPMALTVLLVQQASLNNALFPLRQEHPVATEVVAVEEELPDVVEPTAGSTADSQELVVALEWTVVVICWSFPITTDWPVEFAVVANEVAVVGGGSIRLSSDLRRSLFAADYSV